MPDTTPVKPGLKSTEFWITIFITILGAALALMPEGHWSHGVAGAVLAGLAGMGYSVSRGLAKKPPREGGAIRAPLLLLGSVALALMIALSGCAWFQTQQPKIEAGAKAGAECVKDCGLECVKRCGVKCAAEAIGEATKTPPASQPAPSPAPAAQPSP